ncbi:HNH endonuclease [Leptospira licerasiae]|uniref:HNH endonuclease n=1 Tax=Leptospira licerasiae TaxID=447106 RepID=UPI003019A9D8
MAVTKGQGNPKWTREETILALNLYFKCDRKVPPKTDKRIKDLSLILNSLPYHNGSNKKESFRNSDGVAFKLHNIHQAAHGSGGLKNFSKLDREIWNEFCSKENEVSNLSNLILKGIEIQKEAAVTDNDDEEEFYEGELLTKIHKFRERKPKLRKLLLIERRLNGKLRCDVCGIQSNLKEQDLEEAIFESHHVVPLREALDKKTTIKSLSLLCANCHRLTHKLISKNKKWLSINEIKKIINDI